MNYVEMQAEFYRTFPVMLGKVFVAFIILFLIAKLFENKRMVRILCRFIMLVPVLLVVVVMKLTRY